TCDPTANVVFEILCSATRGKTVDEVKAITPAALAEVLGVTDADFAKKAEKVLELVKRGLNRYTGS
ncbi:MAG TPA: hypothetical protein VLH15_01650, partial [Dehalococcoidales bacterium]|nr:hypothetical protein [Dehalococcoidales bacterium]